MSGEYFINGLQIMKALREVDIVTEIYPSKEVKIDKQLKYANKKGIPYVVIIGGDEVQAKKISLKNMKTGEQETLFIQDAIKKLKAK